MDRVAWHATDITQTSDRVGGPAVANNPLATVSKTFAFLHLSLSRLATLHRCPISISLGVASDRGSSPRDSLR